MQYLPIQWHITNRCQNRCKHCYVFDIQSYENGISNPMSFYEAKEIVDSISEGSAKRDFSVSVFLSGGDPLLCDYFFELLTYLHSKVDRIHILGNPNLLSQEVAQKLKNLGVSSYQMSLEGTKEINDYLRSEGNFESTLKAVKILNKVGIDSHIMMTASKYNSGYLEDVMDIVHNNKVKLFAFARLCSFGEGEILNKEYFAPHEYKDILLRYLEKQKRLIEKGTSTHFAKKDNLFKLLYSDLGLIPGNDLRKGGCGIARGITILPDGTVYACRRFPSPVGSLRQNDFWEIFEGSELAYYKQLDKFEKCNSCELLENCRGCPAVTYGIKKDFFAPDPQCWK